MRHALGVVLLVGLSPAALASGVEPARHVIYLHGRIVQEHQSMSPVHPEYGVYDLAAIGSAFRRRGFVVRAAIRPKAISVDDAADDVVKQVRSLLAAGVPPNRITVIGASMGASIALRAAARLAEPELRFALLGPCISANIPALANEGEADLAGRLLIVREESDIPTSECPPWNEQPKADFLARELVIDTGLDHGFLYRPIPEWFEPVVEWAAVQGPIAPSPD